MQRRMYVMCYIKAVIEYNSIGKKIIVKLWVELLVGGEKPAFSHHYTILFSECCCATVCRYMLPCTF